MMHDQSDAVNTDLTQEDKLQFFDLPFDILMNIFDKLGYKDLAMLTQVNKKLYDLANDNFVWRQKLMKDIHKWKMIDYKTYPKEIFTDDENGSDLDISYKKIYISSCPDVLTKKEILKKLETFQQAQSALHLTSTSENINVPQLGCSNNLTLSSLSSFAMPLTVIEQIKDFIYRNVFNGPPLNENARASNGDCERIPKLVMFGPGLETTTSCLVTNILWKSEFKTIGMVPGKDGYGSGIKLKLFNHRPFNLTILYTNVSKVRSSNNHDINANRLLNKIKDGDTEEYELQPQVKEACSDATGFIYVIDNKHLSSLNSKFEKYSDLETELMKPIDNYKLELNILMREANKDLPLLILSCNTNEESTECAKLMSCVQIVKELELYKLNREWQIRNCEIFEYKMKDIILGFEWILNRLDETYLLKESEKINQDNLLQ